MNGTNANRRRPPPPHWFRDLPRNADLAAEPRRFWWFVASSVYLAFVIYGSLVPLNFRHVPWADAIYSWQNIRFLNLGIGSRADWVANLLLFIPLSFCWAGTIWPTRGSVWRVLASVVLVGAGFALALGIEFVQIYFPPRTVSVNDIGAETLGAVFGVAAWWAWGGRANQWIQTLPFARGVTSVAKRLLIAYLVLFFGYNLLPLDLTISPAELYHKWSEGKLILVPFSARFADRAQQIYGLLTDVAIWVPIAALWRLTDRKSAWHAWKWTVMAAVVLEFLQLFVYSRYTDVTDIITAGIGAAIGVAVVRVTRTDPGTPAPASGSVARQILICLAAVALWLGVLAVVFWYPFDFNFDRSFLRDRVHGLSRVPFEAYYWGSEYRAVTEVLHKTLFMAPLGFLLHVVVSRMPPALPLGLLHIGAILIIAGCAAAVEAGQLALETKNADVTDWLLEFLGGAAGYTVSRVVAAQLRPWPGGHHP